MAVQTIDGISNALPPHPHRRLHILVSILAFLVVVGSIMLYQMNKAKDETLPEARNPNELSEVRKGEIMASLQQTSEKTPPLTDAQINKILQDLRKSSQ